MNDPFEKKVRCAAVAGWWAFLVGAGFITLQWLVYLGVTNARPGWWLAMWGPEISWSFVQATLGQMLQLILRRSAPLFDFSKRKRHPINTSRDGYGFRASFSENYSAVSYNSGSQPFLKKRGNFSPRDSARA